MLNRRKYTLELLEESAILGARHVNTPFNPSSKLYSDQGTPYPDEGAYKRLVGKLLYLTTTRPDMHIHFSNLANSWPSP